MDPLHLDPQYWDLEEGPIDGDYEKGVASCAPMNGDRHTETQL